MPGLMICCLIMYNSTNGREYYHQKRGRLTLNYGEFLGFLGGACTTLGFIPQVVRVLRLKSAREISLPFTLSFIGTVLPSLFLVLVKRIKPLWKSQSLHLRPKISPLRIPVFKATITMLLSGSLQFASNLSISSFSRNLTL